MNVGEILLAAGWIIWRGTEPVPDFALAAVLAEPEFEMAGGGKILFELALKFAGHRLVVSVPGLVGRGLLSLFDEHPGQQASRLYRRVVAVLQQCDPLHPAAGEMLPHLVLEPALQLVQRGPVQSCPRPGPPGCRARSLSVA